MKDTFLCKITCLVVTALLLSLTAASADPENPVLRSNSPKTLMVSQGDKLSLFCESEDPFDYCEWKNLVTKVHFELTL